jgi:hypothetical protein
LQIIDLDRRDFLGIEGLGEEEADQLLRLIDELTVVEGDAAAADTEDESVEPEVEGDDAGAASAGPEDDGDEPTA